MKPLTEKTLELNVMAELAFLGRIAGYKPYFIGFSQWDELMHGADSSYNAGALIGFFQFKRGYPRSWFFTFYINNNAPYFNQHKTLSQNDAICGACRYVFPLLGTNQDVYQHRGNLLALTAFLSPQRFDPLTPARKSHRVRIYYTGMWRRYSDFDQGEWKNVFGLLPDKTPSLEELLGAQSPGGTQKTARQIFDGLELPRIGNVMNRMADTDSAAIRRLFTQRSSFCMVLDEA